MRTSIYADKPWAEIREEYRRGARMDALKVHYGFASTTTVSRKAAEEGWVRDLVGIAQGIAQGAAAFEIAEAKRNIAADLAEGPVPPVRAESIMRRLPISERIVPSALANLGLDDLDEQNLIEAHNLGHAQADKIKSQLSVAQEVQLGGLLLLRRLMATLTDPGDLPVDQHHPDEIRVVANIQRVIRINPDKDTLAGLMTAAGRMVELGVRIERRALNMDAVQGNATPEPPPEAGRQALAHDPLLMAGRMGLDSQRLMRQLAEQMVRERREAQIEGARQS
jgi:hypothetical protein